MRRFQVACLLLFIASCATVRRSEEIILEESSHCGTDVRVVVSPRRILRTGIHNCGGANDPVRESAVTSAQWGTLLSEIAATDWPSMPTQLLAVPDKSGRVFVSADDTRVCISVSTQDIRRAVCGYSSEISKATEGPRFLRMRSEILNLLRDDAAVGGT
jgi:hypothetical protein